MFLIVIFFLIKKLLHDRGAGIIIVNFEDYIKVCYEHLTSKQTNDQLYYSEVTDLKLEKAKQDMNNVLNLGLAKLEYDAMNPEDRKAGRFYCNFKVHKAHDHLPALRPIISGSGSITENIGLFVEQHFKHIATTHDTFIEDTPHFLRCISKLNKGPLLNQHTLIVTWDVIGLFTKYIL